MVELTDDAVYKAIENCKSHNSFHAGIAVSSLKTHRAVCDIIASKIADDDDHQVIRQSPSTLRICWNNNSLLDVFVPQVKQKGRAFHAVVYDKNIEKDALDYLQITEKWKYK